MASNIFPLGNLKAINQHDPCLSSQISNSQLSPTTLGDSLTMKTVHAHRINQDIGYYMKGKWSKEENSLFYCLFCQSIQRGLKSRSETQVRVHAKKMFIRLLRLQGSGQCMLDDEKTFFLKYRSMIHEQSSVEVTRLDEINSCVKTKSNYYKRKTNHIFKIDKYSLNKKFCRAVAELKTINDDVIKHLSQGNFSIEDNAKFASEWQKHVSNNFIRLYDNFQLQMDELLNNLKRVVMRIK